MTKHRLDEPQPTQAQPSIGALFTSAFDDVSTLVQHEIALAKDELRVSFKGGVFGMVLLGVAAVLLLIAVIVGSVGGAYALHFTGLDLAWCYLIVAGCYVLVAALVTLVAVLNLKRVRAPRKAIAEAQAIKATLLDR